MSLKFSQRKKLIELEQYLFTKVTFTNDKRFILYSSLPHTFKMFGFNITRRLGLHKRGCARCKTTTHKINLPTGCLTPKYFVIGVAPGQANLSDACTHRTMSFGPLSDMLKRALWELGIEHKVWFTNIIKCSVEGNRKVTFKEAEKCSSWLKRELKTLKPKRIIILGRNAYDLFVELFPEYSNRVILVYHPSYYIRKGLSWKEYAKHLKERLKKYGKVRAVSRKSVE